MTNFTQRSLTDAILTAGQLEINLTKRKATLGGLALSLTKQEYTVVECLVRRQGTVVTRDEMLSSLYTDPSKKAGIEIINVLVHRVREKLRSAGDDKGIIRTAWSMGYTVRSSMSNTEGDVRNVLGSSFTHRFSGHMPEN